MLHTVDLMKVSSKKDENGDYHRLSGATFSVYYLDGKVVKASFNVYNGMAAQTAALHVYKVDSDENKVDTIADTPVNLVNVGSGSYSYNETAENQTTEVVQSDTGLFTIIDPEAGTYFIGTSNADKDGYYFSVADNSSISFYSLKKTNYKSDNVKYKAYIQTGIAVSAEDPRCYFTRDAYGTWTATASPDNTS
ncbi:MAG: hypothetical protein IJ666_03885 [Ruminococcus sp.]|nr:hypothetical protein [Ruminococcus sp.]